MRKLNLIKLASGVVVTGLLSFGCGSPEAPPPSAAALDEQGTPVDERVIVVQHLDEEGAARLVRDTRTIELQLDPRLEAGLEDAPDLSVVGQIAPPEFPEEQTSRGLIRAGAALARTRSELQATSIDVNGDAVVIGYHARGADRRGAVDLVDVSNPDRPRVLSTAFFRDMDINSVQYVPHPNWRPITRQWYRWRHCYNYRYYYRWGRPSCHYHYYYRYTRNLPTGWIYVAAAVDDSNLPASAVIERLPVNNGRISTNEDRRYPLDGHVATSVRVEGNKIYGTSGAAGGLAVIDARTGKRTWTDLGEARWVDVSDGQYAVVTGGETSEAFVFDVRTDKPMANFDFDGANVAESKTTIELVGNLAFIAGGPEGLRVHNVHSGELVGALPLPQDSGYDPEDVVTNAIAVDGKYAFMSNGGLGVYMAQGAEDFRSGRYTRPGRNGMLDVSALSRLDLDGSVNHVAFKRNVLAIAAGDVGAVLVRVVELEQVEDIAAPLDGDEQH